MGEQCSHPAEKEPSEPPRKTNPGRAENSNFGSTPDQLGETLSYAVSKPGILISINMSYGHTFLCGG